MGWPDKPWCPLRYGVPCSRFATFKKSGVKKVASKKWRQKSGVKKVEKAAKAVK